MSKSLAFGLDGSGVPALTDVGARTKEDETTLDAAKLALRILADVMLGAKAVKIEASLSTRNIDLEITYGVCVAGGPIVNIREGSSPKKTTLCHVADLALRALLLTLLVGRR
jgi:hypothetical protein